MKFKVHRDHLSYGLSRVVHTAAGKVTTPVLGSVLIEADKAAGTISLTTTNLDLHVQCKVKGQVAESGAVLLPVKRLANIVSELPNSDVTCTANARNEVKIESGGSTFKIMGLPKDEFVGSPSRPKGSVQTLDQTVLAQLLAYVAFAQSSDETRYILHGVSFEVSSNKIMLVATDGRRLSMAWAKGEDTAKAKMILPSKSVAELMRLLGPGKSAKFSMDEKRAEFVIEAEDDEHGLIGDICLSSKVIEGNFPDYAKVVPTDTVQRIKLSRAEFLQCVVRAGLVGTEKNNAVRLKLSSGLLEILAQSPEIGEAHERMSIAYEGPEIQVGFSPTYLIDPLRALANDEIFLEVKDDISAGVIKTLDGFMCIVMPVRLS